MFAKDVLRILQVSRPPLTKYIKTGLSVSMSCQTAITTTTRKMSTSSSKKMRSAKSRSFEDIVSLLHCYSMKLYSNRNRLQKIKEAIEDDETSGTPSA